MEKYIQPFVDVCESVFMDFVGSTVTAQRPHFVSREDTHDWDISAIIGLTGEARGAVVLSMHQDLACRITGVLTGSKHSTMDDEVIDAVGEIVNIIAGNAKRGLEEAFRLVISLPTIVKGSGHSIKWPTDHARVICIPFTIFGDKSFCLSVAMETGQDGN